MLNRSFGCAKKKHFARTEGGSRRGGTEADGHFFFARSCLGKIPGGAPFCQRSEQATACTIRMQIVKQINKETN